VAAATAIEADVNASASAVGRSERTLTLAGLGVWDQGRVAAHWALTFASVRVGYLRRVTAHRTFALTGLGVGHLRGIAACLALASSALAGLCPRTNVSARTAVAWVGLRVDAAAVAVGLPPRARALRRVFLEASTPPALQARVTAVDGEAGAFPALQARIPAVDGNTGATLALLARVAIAALSALAHLA